MGDPGLKGFKESAFSRFSTPNDIIVKPLRASPGCLQRLLCAGILLAAPAVASATELFDFKPAFDPAQLTARGVTIAVADRALEIKGTVPASESGVAAQRAQARLEWDAAAGRLPNRPDCDVFAGPGDAPLVRMATPLLH